MLWPMMKWIGLAGMLSAAGCAGASVRLERVSVPEDPAVRVDGALVVEVVTDRDLFGMQDEDVVNLRYNVDGRAPVRTGDAGYDPARVADRLPFGAVLLEADGRRDPRVTRWAVPLSSSLDRRGTVFAYALEDAREHVLTFQVHGFKYPQGASWSSNPVELRLPARPAPPGR